MLTGRITKVAGPVVNADGIQGVKMYEVVEVGESRLIGEIISLERDTATIQVYEDTTGLIPGEPVTSTGMPLSVELGPGLMGTFLDGIQRPLKMLQDRSGDYIERGIKLRFIMNTVQGLDGNYGTTMVVRSLNLRNKHLYLLLITHYVVYD